MEQGENKNDTRNEYRLRFHATKNTAEWQEIRSRYSSLWEQQSGQYLVCISRPEKSKLSHYLADPIKDDTFPIEPMSKQTTVFEIVRRVKAKLGVSPWRSLVVSHKGNILTPNATLEGLQPEYGAVVFLTYRQHESFG